MGARGKREAFSKRLWKTPLHVCTCSQPFPKRLSRPEFPAFSTIAAASIGHALQHKSDPPKRQENPFFQHARDGDLLCRGRRGARALWLGNGLSGPRRARPRPDPGRSARARAGRPTRAGELGARRKRRSGYVLPRRQRHYRAASRASAHPASGAWPFDGRRHHGTRRLRASRSSRRARAYPPEQYGRKSGAHERTGSRGQLHRGRQSAARARRRLCTGLLERRDSLHLRRGSGGAAESVSTASRRRSSIQALSSRTGRPSPRRASPASPLREATIRASV